MDCWTSCRQLRIVGLHGVGVESDPACAGNRPCRSERAFAGQHRRGQFETGSAYIVAGAEEITRHRVRPRAVVSGPPPPFAF